VDAIALGTTTERSAEESEPVSDDLQLEESEILSGHVDDRDRLRSDTAEADDPTAADPSAADPTAADGGATGLDLEARAESDPRTRAELIADLDGVEAQRDEYLDDLRRSHADFENYRKRVVRDAALQRTIGRSDVVTALLDVLDDLDRVVVAADDIDPSALTPDAAAVTSGVQVVAEKARRALEGLGVERVDVAGVPFDPTLHDAVQQVAGEDVGVPTVHEVLRPGYRFPDRVLRPAMVVVAQ
jgi:molecular chaperone GrpE